MTGYTPRNRNPRRDPQHSWSKAFDRLADRQREPTRECGFRVREEERS